MAVYSEPKVLTFTAGGAINQYNVVKRGSSDSLVVECTAAADKSLGVAMSESASGALVEVAVAGGGAKVKLGGTVAGGDLLTSTAAGVAVVAATTERVIGVAMQSGVSGDIIGIEVQISKLP